MVRATARVRRLAQQTPAHRERYVDFLRAVAILAVVTGHWLVVTVDYGPAGRLTGASALGTVTWAHPVTWVFQVMPVFFLVGGFANAASWQAYQARGDDAAAWLLTRSARLVRPTTALLVTVAAAAGVARALGAPDAEVGTAAWLATLPLWFLAAYLAMVALAPVMAWLHRRAGALVPAILVALVLIGDALRFATGSEVPGYGNFLFGWLAVHQIGFFWYDGRLPRRPGPVALLVAGGSTALLALTALGPYPVSMVTVPGAAMQNSGPPTLALLSLAATQLGVVLALRTPVTRWLAHTRPWTVVVGVNAVILTMFLWHMTAVVFVTLVLHAAGLLPTWPAGSPEWLLWQVPWLAMLAIVLAALVALAGPVEARPGTAAGPPRGVAARLVRPLGHRAALTVTTGAGYAAVVTGLLLVALAGRAVHGPVALPGTALAVFLAGAGALWLARVARRAVHGNGRGGPGVHPARGG